jgi:hypothetical protein
MFRAVYGDVIGNVFGIAAVVAVAVVLAVVFVKEVPLRQSNSPALATPDVDVPAEAADAGPGTNGRVVLAGSSVGTGTR